jgi:hypothetical protein
MNDSELYEALVRIVDPKLLKRISSTIVIQSENGEYTLFGKYIITKKKGLFHVCRQTDDSIRSFNTLKNAVAWITADKRQDFSDAIRIDFLDKSLGGVSFDILLHKKLCGSTKNMDMRIIYAHKLQQDLAKQQVLTTELDGIVARLRRYQDRQFKLSTLNIQ